MLCPISDTYLQNPDNTCTPCQDQTGLLLVAAATLQMGKQCNSSLCFKVQCTPSSSLVFLSALCRSCMCCSQFWSLVVVAQPGLGASAGC